LHNIPIPL